MGKQGQSAFLVPCFGGKNIRWLLVFSISKFEPLAMVWVAALPPGGGGGRRCHDLYVEDLFLALESLRKRRLESKPESTMPQALQFVCANIKHCARGRSCKHKTVETRGADNHSHQWMGEQIPWGDEGPKGISEICSLNRVEWQSVATGVLMTWHKFTINTFF